LDCRYAEQVGVLYLLAIPSLGETSLQRMPAIVKTTDYECPICQGHGRVPGRLPGRTRLCPECHGTGRTTPIRREQLLKKAKQRA